MELYSPTQQNGRSQAQPVVTHKHSQQPQPAQHYAAQLQHAPPIRVKFASISADNRVLNATESSLYDSADKPVRTASFSNELGNAGGTLNSDDQLFHDMPITAHMQNMVRKNVDIDSGYPTSSNSN